MSRKFQIQQKITVLDQASLVHYLREIRVYDILTKVEEIKLFNEYSVSNNSLIKDKIIQSNLRWVVSVAKQYSYPKAKLADLINEGNIGLIIAVDKFDISLGYSFITFATSYIRQSITTYCNNILAEIPQPSNRVRLNKMIKKTFVDLTLMGNENPTDEQIVEHYMSIKESTDLKLNTVLLNEVRNNAKPTVSMHSSVSDTDGQLELCDTFKAGNDWSADFKISQNDKSNEVINKLANILHERELKIIVMQFGLMQYEPHTLEQIANKLSFTRERIGQISKIAIDKLKAHKKLMFQILGTSKNTIHSNESII